jgi:multidrug efflux pump subunit AcrA (membrane-fusion protein)
MQAQQQQQDPLVQMQQAELALKQAREQREAQKDQADIMLKAQAQQDKVRLEEERIRSMQQIAEQNIAAKMIDKAADIQRERDIEFRRR